MKFSVSELFSQFAPSGTKAPAPVAAPANVGAIPGAAAAGGATVATAATAANGVIPAAATETPTVESKLDPFKDIWNTAATDSSQGQPLFSTSREALMELARKENFKPTLTQEQMTAIAAGGPEAVQAMMEAMNDMSQRVYAQSAHASTQLIEAAAKKMSATTADSMAAAMNKRQVQTSLQEANPALRNPAVAPLIQMATNQLTQKHPTASPQEITAMAQSYVLSLAEAFQAPQTAAAAAAQQAEVTAKEEDWTKFFAK